MEEIKFNPLAFPQVGETGAIAPTHAGSGAPGQASFMGTLKQAIAETNELQFQASEAVNRMVTGADQSLHQTMVALQKADISFQLMMQIRNKIVTAYQEIQRMQL